MNLIRHFKERNLVYYYELKLIKTNLFISSYICNTRMYANQMRKNLRTEENNKLTLIKFIF